MYETEALIQIDISSDVRGFFYQRHQMFTSMFCEAFTAQPQNCLNC